MVRTFMRKPHIFTTQALIGFRSGLECTAQYEHTTDEIQRWKLDKGSCPDISYIILLIRVMPDLAVLYNLKSASTLTRTACTAAHHACIYE